MLAPPPAGLNTIAIEGRPIRCGRTTSNHQSGRVVRYVSAVAIATDGEYAEIFTDGGVRLPNGRIELFSGDRCALRRTDHGWHTINCELTWEF